MVQQRAVAVALGTFTLPTVISNSKWPSLKTGRYANDFFGSFYHLLTTVFAGHNRSSRRASYGRTSSPARENLPFGHGV